MESYLVKIYRQEKQNQEKAVGIAEHVSTGKQTVFTSAEELWRLINSGQTSDDKPDRRQMT